MILVPGDTQVLVVRAWREPREEEIASEVWRVSIEDVGSGARRSFSDQSTVHSILHPILSRLGSDYPFSKEPGRI